jgi:hypothetical protein
MDTYYEGFKAYRFVHDVAERNQPKGAVLYSSYSLISG